MLGLGVSYTERFSTPGGCVPVEAYIQKYLFQSITDKQILHIKMEAYFN